MKAQQKASVSKRKNDKGRQPPWISVYRHTWKSPAWRVLSVGARALYVELAANYNTKMQNAVFMSLVPAQKVLPAGGSNLLDVLLDLGRERLQDSRWGLGVRLLVLLVVRQRRRDTREKAGCGRDLFDHCFRLCALPTELRQR